MLPATIRTHESHPGNTAVACKVPSDIEIQSAAGYTLYVKQTEAVDVNVKLDYFATDNPYQHEDLFRCSVSTASFDIECLGQPHLKPETLRRSTGYLLNRVES